MTVPRWGRPADHLGVASTPGAILARLGRRDAGGAAAAAARGGRCLGGPGALGQRRRMHGDGWDGDGVGHVWSISTICGTV